MRFFNSSLPPKRNGAPTKAEAPEKWLMNTAMRRAETQHAGLIAQAGLHCWIATRRTRCPTSLLREMILHSLHQAGNGVLGSLGDNLEPKLQGGLRCHGADA